MKLLPIALGLVSLVGAVGCSDVVSQIDPPAIATETTKSTGLPRCLPLLDSAGNVIPGSMADCLEANSGSKQLPPEIQRGKEYAEKYGIAWTSLETYEVPPGSYPNPKDDVERYVNQNGTTRSRWSVHMVDGTKLINPSFANNDVVDNSEMFSQADMTIFQRIRGWNDYVEDRQ